MMMMSNSMDLDIGKVILHLVAPEDICIGIISISIIVIIFFLNNILFNFFYHKVLMSLLKL
jgi:hypothetical protein